MANRRSSRCSLRALAGQVARILAEDRSRRTGGPAGVALYSVDQARRLKGARRFALAANPSDPQQHWRIGVGSATLSAVAAGI